MNQRNIILTGFLVVLLPLALLLGQWSATDPVVAMGFSVGIVVLLVVVVLGRYVWLLIPLFHPFIGAFRLLPGGFALRDVVIGGVSVFLLIIWMVRRFELRIRLGSLEFILLLQYVWLAQAFVRRPAGFYVLGSETVGGRAYVEIPIALVGFFILASQVVDLKRVKQASSLFVCGGVGSALLQVFATVVPAAGMVIMRGYELVGGRSIMNAASQSNIVGSVINSVGRKEYLSFLVKPLFAWLMAITRPLGLINPRRPLIVITFGIVMVAALLSGFRSLLLWITMLYIAAAIVRRYKVDILVACLGGIILIVAATAGNGSLFDLPLSVQRTLSFLPGDWHYMAKESAEDTVNWRFVMWKEALFTDKFIENKWIGDGYGLRHEDLALQAQILTAEVVTPEMMQEHFMRSGDYHSGPVETIHRVGYLGLILLTVGMIVIARYAVKIIRLTEKSPYYVCVMFIGLPMIIYPAFFYLVIGGHKEALVIMTFSGGMLRMIENSINKYGLGLPVSEGNGSLKGKIIS